MPRASKSTSTSTVTVTVPTVSSVDNANKSKGGKRKKDAVEEDLPIVHSENRGGRVTRAKTREEPIDPAKVAELEAARAAEQIAAAEKKAAASAVRAVKTAEEVKSIGLQYAANLRHYKKLDNYYSEIEGRANDPAKQSKLQAIRSAMGKVKSATEPLNKNRCRSVGIGIGLTNLLFPSDSGRASLNYFKYERE